jgi:hypothetical protein
VQHQFGSVRTALDSLEFGYREFIVDPAELGIQLVSLTIAGWDLAMGGQCAEPKCRLLEGEWRINIL